MGALEAFLKACPSDTYRAAFKAYRALLDDSDWLDKIEAFSLTTTSRLIIGLGIDSALQFGLTFHPTYGTPMIPGSSLKGVVSAYAASVGGPEWAKSGFENQSIGGQMGVEIFGGLLSAQSSKRLVGGSVAFLDALWIPRDDSQESPYQLEIVNPHYGGYYGGGVRPPDGMENPIPFQFLALRKGEKFLFALQGPDEARREARKILELALEHSGVGGKTALGYGRFGAG